MYGMHGGRVTWGVTLILLGTLFLLERFGLLPSWAWHFQWWAMLVIAIGIVLLCTPRRADHVGNGVMFVLLGVWFLLVTNHQYGLTWQNSWPLALVATGAGTVARAIAARWLPDRFRFRREEEPHA
jgi:hypothetical protein